MRKGRIVGPNIKSGLHQCATPVVWSPRELSKCTFLGLRLIPFLGHLRFEPGGGKTCFRAAFRDASVGKHCDHRFGFHRKARTLMCESNWGF